MAWKRKRKKNFEIDLRFWHILSYENKKRNKQPSKQTHTHTPTPTHTHTHTQQNKIKNKTTTKKPSCVLLWKVYFTKRWDMSNTQTNVETNWWSKKDLI